MSNIHSSLVGAQKILNYLAYLKTYFKALRSLEDVFQWQNIKAKNKKPYIFLSTLSFMDSATSTICFMSLAVLNY